MKWWRMKWRNRSAEADEALAEAQELRRQAESRNDAITSITERVDEVARSLERLRRENHFGPMIDSALRGRTGP